MPSKLKSLARRLKKSKVLKGVQRGLKNQNVRRLINSTLSAAGIDAKQRKAMVAVPRAAMALFGDRKKKGMSNISVPAASNVIQSNVTFSEVVGKITSDYAGSTAQGVRIRGCQPFTKVLDPTGVGKVLASDVATTVLDGLDTTVLINPLYLNGPLLTQASNYTMYAFRKFRLEYVATVGSIYTGEYAICYVREPTPAALAAGAVPTNFAEAREVVPSAAIPYRSERIAFEWTYDGQQLYYIHDTDPTAESDDRLSIQGQIRAYAPSVGAGGATGYFTLSYELDLFYPTINTVGAFAATHLHGLTPSDLQALRPHIRAIRERKERPAVKKLSLQLRDMAFDRDEGLPSSEPEYVIPSPSKTTRSMTPSRR